MSVVLDSHNVPMKLSPNFINYLKIHEEIPQVGEFHLFKAYTYPKTDVEF